MSLRKLLHSFISSLSSSSSVHPLSKYNCRCSSIQRNHASLFYFCTVSSPSSVGPPLDTLFHRLMGVQNPNDSIVRVLDQWVSEGRRVDLNEFRKVIRDFRHFKRFGEALQISEWMNNTKYFNVTPGDAAVQLDLISKVHGLEQAEKFFNSMQDESIPIQIYGSLLNCYADAKALDKAEAIMERMRKLGYTKTLSYNVMLSLYYQMGKYEKFNLLVQEMEEKGIYNDQVTYIIRLNAYSAVSDTVGMEKLLMQMEADPMVTMDWTAYGVVANGYLKAGAFNKAYMVLKKSEKLMGRRSDVAHRVLISLYAKMGRKDEIYHIWNKQKKSGKLSNMSYIIIVSSLVKLKDLDGAEKMLAEWQEKMKFFDSRLPHLLVLAYCRMGHVEKAESLVNKLIEGGHEPNTNTWSLMASRYIQNNQMEKAVDTIEKAITSSDQYRQLHPPTLAQCLEYLNSKGDAGRVKKIIGMLDERGKFSVEFREKLVAYIRNRNLASKKI